MSIPAEKQFSMQVAELGFSYQQESGGNYIRSSEKIRWHLHQPNDPEDDRWVLYVRDVPQIVFHPHEVLKFLQKQAAHVSPPTSPQPPTKQIAHPSQPVHPR